MNSKDPDETPHVKSSKMGVQCTNTARSAWASDAHPCRIDIIFIYYLSIYLFIYLFIYKFLF